jgi:hypothetical protein
MDDDRPLPSQILPEFNIDPDPVLTQFYRNKIQHYIRHPPPFTKEELMRASKIMFDVRHPEANPLLFRSIVGPAGITKKGYGKEFKDKKNHYLAFQRALVSLEPLPPQVAAPMAPPPLQRVQSYPPVSASFMPYSPLAPLAPSSATPSSATPSSATPSSATPSRDLDERIRELRSKITHAPIIRKKIYQVQLAELIRQQQEQQQQDNGGGKKYKKRSTKKRSTKKRSTKKQSKSIKKKPAMDDLPNK